MYFFTRYRYLLLLAWGALLTHAAQAQNNPVASPLVMASLMPVASLNVAPEPAELASYYDGTHKDLRPALDWMQQLNASQPTYWTLYTEARIQLALRHYAEAARTASRARRLAQVAAPANSPYLHLSAAVFTDAQRHLGEPASELASVKAVR